MDVSNIAPLADFAAIVVGSLFAALLSIARGGNQCANRWLAGCIAGLALLSVGDLLEDTRWAVQYPQLAHTTDWLIFALGPCVWLYVRRLTSSPSPRGGRVALHFMPAALAILLVLPFHLIPTTEEQSAIVVTEIENTSRNEDPVLVVAVLHILTYWLAALFTLYQFGGRLREQYSSIEKRSFRWISWVLAVTFVMWLFWLSGLALRTEWTGWLDLVAVPVGLYVLALAGLSQPKVFLEPAVEEAPRRYARSGLDPPRLAELRTRLDELMQLEKPWLENDLTLSQLAARLGVSPHHLSQVLNDALGQSFFDYVNSRRVAEVKRCLGDPAYASQTLIEIALAAGFNSKAAFNTAFRKHTGLTPSQFRLRSSSGKSQ